MENVSFLLFKKNRIPATLLLHLCKGIVMHTQEIQVGGIYRHYKGKLYKVVAIAVDTELAWIDDPAQITDEQKRVIYHGIGEGHALSTEIIWDRPYQMFAGEIEIDGVATKRFAPV